MKQTLADVINQRLDELGLTPRAASLKAGLHEDAVRNILRGKSTSPRGRTLTGLARALDMNVDELASFTLREFEPRIEEGKLADQLVWKQRTVKNRQATTIVGGIPVFATREVQGGAVVIMGFAVERTSPSEPVRAVEGSYAIYAPNDLLAPRCEQGDLLHIHPHRPARPGQLVLVRHKSDAEGNSKALLRELVANSLDSIVVRTLNPERKEKIDREEIEAVHLVVGVITP